MFRNLLSPSFAPHSHRSCKWLKTQVDTSQVSVCTCISFELRVHAVLVLQRLSLLDDDPKLLAGLF